MTDVVHPGDPAAPAVELREVVLVDVPVALMARAQERQDGLLRELALVRGAPGSAPERLVELSALADRRYGSFTAAGSSRLEAAAREGLDHVTVAYRVPVPAGPFAAELLAVLREVDGHCRGGQLLTTPPDAELAAFRDWFLSQFVVQLRGGPSTPWGAGPP